jgi:hypothetical protein
MPTVRRSVARLVTPGASRKLPTTISPESMVSRPFTVLMKVLLPDPDGPQITTTSPRAMLALQSLRT